MRAVDGLSGGGYTKKDGVSREDATEGGEEGGEDSVDGEVIASGHLEFLYGVLTSNKAFSFD